MEKNGIPVVDLSKEEETCIDCGEGLGYLKSTSIEVRPFFTEGNGDRCPTCFRISHLKAQIAELSRELTRLEQLKAKPNPS